MFERQSIEISCPQCGKETKKTVAWIKSHDEFTCSGCRNRVDLDHGKFLKGLADPEKMKDFARNPGKRR